MALVVTSLMEEKHDIKPAIPLNEIVGEEEFKKLQEKLNNPKEENIDTKKCIKLLEEAKFRVVDHEEPADLEIAQTHIEIVLDELKKLID